MSVHISDCKPPEEQSQVLTHIHGSKFSAVSRLVYLCHDDEEELEDFSSIISNATTEFYRLPLRIFWMVSSFSHAYLILPSETQGREVNGLKTNVL